MHQDLVSLLLIYEDGIALSVVSLLALCALLGGRRGKSTALWENLVLSCDSLTPPPCPLIQAFCFTAHKFWEMGGFPNYVMMEVTRASQSGSAR